MNNLPEITDFDYSFLNLSLQQRDEIIQDFQRESEIDNTFERLPLEENIERTDSAVSYPSSISSTTEQVDYILELIQIPDQNLRRSNFARPTFSQQTDDLYGYQNENFNWSYMMPPEVTPTIIQPVENI